MDAHLQSTNSALRSVASIVVACLAICVVSLINSTVHAYMQPKPIALAQPFRTISTAVPQNLEIDRVVSSDGAASAWESIAVSCEANGLKIDSVLAKEGQRVKRGQALAILNDSILRAELAEATAELLASKANLHKSVQPNRLEEIASLQAAEAQAADLVAEAQAAMLSARTRCLNVEANAKRYDSLLSQGAVSEMEAENTRAAAISMRAELSRSEEQVKAAKNAEKQGKERLKLALAGGRQEDISVSQSAVLAAQARLNKLQALIAQTTIRAPEDGLIVKSDARHGELAVAGRTLFNLVRDDRLELKVKLPEQELLRVHPGQIAEIRTNRNAKEMISGRVRELSPSMDERSRLGLARIDIAKIENIIPGMFFHVDIKVGRDQVQLLPREAVLDDEGQAYVYELVGASVKKVFVKVGDIYGDNVEILSDLAPDAQIAVCGASFLKDGDCVKVAKP